MRATVTIADDLFREADRVAGDLGLSRSRLYQEALEHHLRHLRDQALTEQMNRHVEEHGQALDPSFRKYIARVWAHEMGGDEW